MGVAPDEFAVPTGAIHHDIGISRHRTGEENRRTRGPRPKPTGGVRPARDGPIQTRRRSEGSDGQVGGSGGRLATIGGPACGAQDKGRRAPPGPPVVRIGALLVVRPPDRGAEATRGDAGCSRPAGPAGRATRRGVPAAGPGGGRKGGGLAKPGGGPRCATSAPRESSGGGREGRTRRPGAYRPAAKGSTEVGRGIKDKS